MPTMEVYLYLHDANGQSFLFILLLFITLFTDVTQVPSGSGTITTGPVRSGNDVDSDEYSSA